MFELAADDSLRLRRGVTQSTGLMLSDGSRIRVRLSTARPKAEPCAQYDHLRASSWHATTLGTAATSKRG